MCPILLSDFNQIRSFATDFRKGPSTKFPENPPTGSRTDTCGQTDNEELKSGFLPFTMRRHLKKLYVCIYIYIYIYTHTHTHIRIYTHIHTQFLAPQCLSVHMYQCGSHWTDFREILYWDFYESLLRNSEFG